jgi:putative glutamine amidotransferase
MTTIGISKASGNANYERYIHWMNASADDITCIDLSLQPSVDAALEALERCDGLLLTGGPDVNPARYDQASELPRCFIDQDRDDLEFPLYAKAKTLKMPVLGVCRGAQVINVAEGGLLVVDIPADCKPAKPLQSLHEHARIQDVDSTHAVLVEQGSILTKITGEIDGRINSAHHQAASSLGEGLCASAFSDDGICEGVEWQDTTGKPFLLGVQWHPERMDWENPFSLRIAEHFAFEAASYRLLAKRINA